MAQVISRNEKYMAIARVAIELADSEDRDLDQIQLHLEAGRDEEAIARMRDFFRVYRKKQPDREHERYDREREKARA